jgi:hypothetical protein
MNSVLASSMPGIFEESVGEINPSMDHAPRGRNLNMLPNIGFWVDHAQIGLIGTSVNQGTVVHL